jgi:hypothetical protein
MMAVIIAGVLWLWLRDPVPALRSPERMTIYSLDPRVPVSIKILNTANSTNANQDAKLPKRTDVSQDKTRGAPSAEHFHDYPVLGKVEITETNQLHEIAKALKKGLVPPILKILGMSACFIPRHGIRAIDSGHTIDCVICYECKNIDVYVDGRSTYYGPITLNAEPVLARCLGAAGIKVLPTPLPPLEETQ